MRLLRFHSLSLAAWLVATLPGTRAAMPMVALKPICLGQLQAPVNISNAADGSGRLFVCEQRGQIRIILGGMLLPLNFLDLAAKIVPSAPTTYQFPLSAVYDERGLLGLAFHPGYANSLSPGYRKFYVFYSAPAPVTRGTPTPPNTTPTPINCRTTISEFQVSNDPNIADPNSERVLLAFDKPQSNHNGGQLAFGPDGYLYFSTGDGGGANDTNVGHNGATNPPTAGNLGNAQDLTRLYGKIHRIDPLDPDGAGPLTYAIPASNPFKGAGGGVREEIYAYGLRNTWRFSWDTGSGGTGRFFAADVGQNQVEEIDLVTAGANYGWHAREGAFTFDSALQTALLSGGSVRVDGGTTTLPGGAVLTGPIAQYAHPGVTVGAPALPQLGTSITGGFVYRGGTFAALVGKYVFGDYNFGAINSGTTKAALLGIEETSPNVWSTPAAIPVVGPNPVPTTHLLAFGRDEQGELYLATEVMQGPQNDANGTPTGGIYKIVAPVAVTTTLNPAKDNTIFSEDALSGLFTSDGLDYIFAGKTGSSYGPYLRRALLAFDLAPLVSAGAAVQSAQLSVNVNRLGAFGNNTTLSLYRLNETWGEGTSLNPDDKGYGATATTGDATWSRRFYDPMTVTAWSTAGGAFNASASASTTAHVGLLTFASSAGLIADVQAWIDTPASNAGWILRGNETTETTAARFDSRNLGTNPPALQISYLTGPTPTRREAWMQQYFPVGKFVDFTADLDGDKLNNQLEYAFAYSPLAVNSPIAPNAAVQAYADPAGSDVLFTVFFRRDPRATDLTYIPETSSDLVTWTTLAQSVGGAVPTGSGFLSEADATGETPIKSVIVQETVPASESRYARVRVVPYP